MQVKLYNLEGKETGTFDLSDKVFAVKVKNSLIHQIYNALMANARQPWAHTKDKSEVRGGGKKPWRQKGTGRARHGSIRSPIWKGGGVTFGPLKKRNYKQKINKKMNQQSVRMCLSDKAKEEKLVVLEDLVKDGKTKTMAALREVLPGSGRSTILLTAKNDPSVTRAIQNIQKFDIQRASDVNVVDLLHHQYVLATKESVKVLEKRLSA